MQKFTTTKGIGNNRSSSSASAADRRSPLYYCFGLTRYAVLVLSTLCLSLIASNWLALNYTVICMVTDQQKPFNDSDINGIKMPLFTANEQGWLFTGAMVGRVVGTPPVSHIIARIGFRKTFLAYCVLSILATVFTPIFVKFGGFFGLFFLQIIQGIAVSVGWSAAGVISSGWSPPDTYGMFLSVVTLNFQIGPVITMPLAAAFCSSDQLGWPAVYYLLGSITFICSALFYAFYRDSPREQKNVSKRELALIESRQLSSTSSIVDVVAQRDHSHQQMGIPYRAILSDPIIWAQLCAHITRNLGYMIPLVYGAIYFNKALGVPISSTGVTAAFPFLFCIFIKLLGGTLCDRMTCLSEKCRVILFSSIQYVAAACYLLLGLAPKFGFKNLTFMECCFVGITTSLVLCLIGEAKCSQLVARQHAHVIFAWQYLLTSTIFLIIPVGISWVAPNNTIEEWSLVFLCSAFSVSAGIIVFNATVRVEPRSWVVTTTNEQRKDDRKERENEEEAFEKNGENEHLKE